jgi:nucleoid DNA-binding protein
MTKKQLAAKLAAKAGISQAKANEILTHLFSAEPNEGLLALELDAGEKVTIPGFGTFGVRSRAARKGTNPGNSAEITIPARQYVFFKPGKTLRERIDR